MQIHQHSPNNIISEEHHHHHHHLLIISTPPPSKRPLPNLLHKDAILLPTTSTYEEILNQLYQRVLARSAGSFPPAAATGAALNDGMVFCRLALLVDNVDNNQQQQQILIDQGNWIAARTFLRFRENVELVFHFCFVPSTFHGGGGGGGQGWLMQYIRRRRRRRRRWGVGMAGRICLVEPSFDVLGS